MLGTPRNRRWGSAATWALQVPRRGWDELRAGRIPEPHVLAMILHVACGLTVIVTMPFATSFVHPLGTAIVALAAIAGGFVIASLPWSRWPEGRSKWLIPEALGLVVAFNLVAQEPFLFSLFYLVTWAWVGLTQVPGTALRFSPVLAAAYVIPGLFLGAVSEALVSAVYVVPVAVVVGETVALVAEHLRESRADVERSEARYAALVRHASEFVLVLDREGRVSFANEAVRGILGWEPHLLVGTKARMLVHPADVAQVVDWYRWSRDTDDVDAMEIRCLHVDGTWRWIEGGVQDLQHLDAVGGVVVNGRDISARRRAEAELEQAAFTDSLTGLMNRAALQGRIEEQLSHPRGGPVAILYLDLDGFKVINDSLGHPVGDALLQEVSARLCAVVPDGMLSRIGGDEFVVLLPGMGDHDRVKQIAHVVVASFDRPFELDGRRLQVGVSIGVAISDLGSTTTELLRSADLAMYEAKSDGGRQWVCFDQEMARRAQRRLDTEEQLREALEDDQLVVEYQPEIDVETGRVVCAEALVRWHHPRLGRVGPDEFIGIAEETGLIAPLGELVLERAVETARLLADSGHLIPVSVNISAHQLRRPSIVRQVESALSRWSVPASCLRLEITESALLESEPSNVVVPALRALGVSVAIDDFGTGYSSLSKLQSLTVDTLKIDKSFVAATLGGQPSPLVDAIVAMAHNLDLGVVAEGVETHEQLAVLRQVGCTRVQGFLFAASMPRAELLEYLDGDLHADVVRVHA